MMSDKALWCAVIRQAITDATLPLSTKRRSDRIDQMRSREWLTEPNGDFEEVCGLADLDPVEVRKHVLPLIAEATKNDQPMAERTPQRRVRSAARHTPGVAEIITNDRRDRCLRSTQETRKLEIF